MGEDVRRGPETAAERRAALRRAGVVRRWSEAKEMLFFEELTATSNVSQAAARAGMSAGAAYYRRGINPTFAARWVEALEAGYAALEMALLHQTINGSERIETVTAEDGAVKQVKTIHSFPHAVAIRLLQTHREAVERFRALNGARDGGDPELAATIKAELARVRARLMDGSKNE
ncbi:hypothetical protein BH10PLA2_BH10PLA2_00080 [soil metagenome]